MAKTVNGSGKSKSARSKKGGGAPKGADGKPSTGVEALRGNGYDKVMTTEFVESIEECQADIDDIMEKARDKCAPLREEINGIKKDAHDKGLPRRELNAVLSKRRAQKRIEDIRAKLNTEQQDNFDQLEQALGMLKDLPLGQSALDAVRGQERADA